MALDVTMKSLATSRFNCIRTEIHKPVYLIEVVFIFPVTALIVGVFPNKERRSIAWKAKIWTIVHAFN